MKKIPQDTFSYYKDYLAKEEKEKLERGVYFPIEMYDIYVILLKVEKIKNSAAYVFRDMEHHNIVFVFDNDIEEYVAVHEMGHLAFHILDQKNVPIDYHNQECFCYLLDYIYREVMKILRKHKKEWGLKKL